MAGGFLPEGFLPTGHLPDGYLPEGAATPGGTPNQLYFDTRFKAELSTQYVSSVAVITGLSAPAESVVANGEQSVNGSAFTSGTVNVDTGDELRLRRDSSADPATPAAVTATIGSVVGSFVIVTAAAEVVRTSWRRRAVVPFRRRAA
jgi:hypothetical protein